MKYVLGLSIALTAAAAAAAGDWPVIERPPHAEVEWVARDMRLNGVPMRIQRFSAKAGVQEVLGYYRARWGSAQERRTVENTVGPWSVIGRRVGDYYLTVQVKPVDHLRSEGFLAVSRLPVFEPQRPPGEGFPRLGDSAVVSDLESNDDGKAGRTLVIRNYFSVQANTEFYRSQLAAQGWREDPGYGRVAAHPHIDGQALYFRRGNEALHIVVNANRGVTTVLANLTTLSGESE